MTSSVIAPQTCTRNSSVASAWSLTRALANPTPPTMITLPPIRVPPVQAAAMTLASASSRCNQRTGVAACIFLARVMNSAAPIAIVTPIRIVNMARPPGVEADSVAATRAQVSPPAGGPRGGAFTGGRTRSRPERTGSAR